MTRVLDRQIDGSYTLPADLVSAAQLGDSLTVEVGDGSVVLRSRDAEAMGADTYSGANSDAAPADPAAEFVEWVRSLPDGSGLSDWAVSRDSVYN